jgi:hypothetical protein
MKNNSVLLASIASLALAAIAPAANAIPMGGVGNTFTHGNTHTTVKGELHKSSHDSYNSLTHTTAVKAEGYAPGGDSYAHLSIDAHGNITGGAGGVNTVGDDPLAIIVVTDTLTEASGSASETFNGSLTSVTETEFFSIDAYGL